MIYRWGSEEKKKGSDGMANAAIETFRSGNVMAGFVRELVQNSQDARSDNGEPLKIRIRLFSINKSEIPAFEKYWIPIYKAVKNDWSKGYPGFFEKADDVLGNEEIMVLEYSDFNTVGLSGEDNDDKSTFSACVLSEGNSAEKSNDAGGSYGIGKNAVYGLSGIRTILYSSLNERDEYIFQGVSKLASYKQENKSFGSRVYLGRDNYEISSIRTPQEIPDRFKRTDKGLSQFILGANLNEGWITEIKNLAINNYFILLNESKIVFELLDELTGNTEIIDVNNFKDIAEKHFLSATENEQLNHVWPKIRALNTISFKDDLTYYTGEKLEDALIVHFINDTDCGQNIVTYTRRGMQIFCEKLHPSGGIGYLNLIGVFYSNNQKINSILRSMEPASHDSWKKELLTDRVIESKELIWAIELEKKIKEFIRKNAKTFLKEFSSETHTISEVDELLNIGNNPSGAFKPRIRRSGQIDEKIETTLKTGQKYEVDLKFSSLEKNIVEGEFLDIPAPKSSTKGERSGVDKKRHSRQGGKSSTSKGPISYKCILQDEEEDIRNYILLIKATDPSLVDFEINQAGDRGSKLRPDIISVIQNEKSITVEEFEDRAIIKGISFIEGIANLNVKIKSLSKAGIIIQPFKF